MREIKFRAWDGEHIYNELTLKSSEGLEIKVCEMDGYTFSQFTGLKDKNGVEVYEGDIVEIRMPSREEQTHEGDNIPMGSYTEPLEPTIDEHTEVVEYKNGMFSIDDYPLWWLICQFPSNIDELKDSFSGCWSALADGELWKEDLQYLLEEYNLKDANELMDYIGIKVIGNIYEHSHLLEGESNEIRTR